MKRVLLMGAAALVFASSAQARSFGRDDCDEGCLFFAQQLRACLRELNLRRFGLG